MKKLIAILITTAVFITFSGFTFMPTEHSGLAPDRYKDRPTANRPITDDLLMDDQSTDDEYYFVTVIEDEPGNTDFVVCSSSSKKTATKSKTTYCKNSKGKVMWYVKVTGTFRYGNGTSKCIKSRVKAKSKSKMWSVYDKHAWKTGNKAKAKAKGKLHVHGVTVKTIRKTVTLKCSPTGRFS